MTKTEAEKRGAKFGTMGVIKNSGKKCVYIGDSVSVTGSWEIALEGCVSTWSMPHNNIRLAHEPEFKEIQFCDATHEQRMAAENVSDKYGETVSDIFWSEKKGTYVILFQNGETYTSTPTSSRYTVRVPT